MGIVKLLIFALVVWLGFIAFKKFRRAPSSVDSHTSAHKMLSCSKCKTHIPENEAIIHNGKVYCSKECL